MDLEQQIKEYVLKDYDDCMKKCSFDSIVSSIVDASQDFESSLKILSKSEASNISLKKIEKLNIFTNEQIDQLWSIWKMRNEIIHSPYAKRDMRILKLGYADYWLNMLSFDKYDIQRPQFFAVLTKHLLFEATDFVNGYIDYEKDKEKYGDRATRRNSIIK